MERCTRCGATDPLRMFGLMSHWFASPAGLALEGGYFYLCPRCFDETIAPGLDEILDKLREHLPAPPTTAAAGYMHAPGDGQAPAQRVQRPGPPAKGKAPETPADSAARADTGADGSASSGGPAEAGTEAGARTERGNADGARTDGGAGGAPPAVTGPETPPPTGGTSPPATRHDR